LVVDHAGDAINLAASDGFLYWVDDPYVGRVTLNGAHLDRHYLRLPAEGHGVTDVADGIAVVGSDLYFSQCIGDRIGHVSLSTSSESPPVEWIISTRCPQALSVGAGQIFWSGGGTSYVGRADLDGNHSDPRWLFVGGADPLYLASAGGFLYWVWSEARPPPTPSYLARVSIATGTNAELRFRRAAEGAITTAPSPS
jgi:hypothetical protein